MVIKPSTEFSNNYGKLADFCIETGETVFLTHEGKGELVVMSVERYNEERQTAKIQNAVLAYEKDKQSGNISFSPFEEAMAEIIHVIDGRSDY